MSNNSKLVEVVFKGERRVIFRNRQELSIQQGDFVIVEAERGHELGRVSLVGSLVRLKKGKGETRGIVRQATDADKKSLEANNEKEKESFAACKQKIRDYNLDMKLIDVEMQFDGSKITFYFTSAQRVDFRELVKDLASIYRTRIELRQIGVRDEARRYPGIGICGRSQCCSGFLIEFEQITTQMAKDQQLSLNPTKISGNCGRLLCCLRYEVDMYTEVLHKFPPIGSSVRVREKNGTLSFVNVFQEKGFVRFPDHTEEWIPLAEFANPPSKAGG